MGSSSDRLSVPVFCVVAVAPVVLAGVMVLLLTTDATRGFAMRMSRENSVIELVTAGLLLVGSICGFGLALKVRKFGRPAFVWGFLLMFSVGMFLVGMEEIAWGQKLYAYQTPKALENVNRQREMTLHNMPGLHGRSDLMWSSFALAGLIGIGLRRRRLFEAIAPPAAMATWFLIVLAVGFLMILRDYVDVDNRLFMLAHRMDEFTEMLIAMTSCVYLVFCARRLVQQCPEADPPPV